MIRQILINRRRILMSSNPLSIIANFMMMQLIYRITPISLIGIISLFVKTISELFFSNGFLNTIKILLGIRQALNIRGSFRVLKDILSGRSNPIAIENLIGILEPEWPKILKEGISFNKILNMLLRIFIFNYAQLFLLLLELLL
uniref:hypothetical protein n=1 Tax=Fomitopsis dickinsii TaxID=3151107 RepID=UPI002A83E838|nr:hypothetical protein UYH45_mgp04 [Daedalea dickinsii]WNZ34366.1 hypothetical protein [Daedalea dickinsii]